MSSFAEDVIVSVKDPKHQQEEVLEVKTYVGRSQATKPVWINQLYFSISAMMALKNKIKKCSLNVSLSN